VLYQRWRCFFHSSLGSTNKHTESTLLMRSGQYTPSFKGTGAALLPGGKFLENCAVLYRETTDFDLPSGGGNQFAGESFSR
jgi:hypothetical protein